MDMNLKERFLALWKRYFNNSEPPFVIYYTDHEGTARKAPPAVAHCCLMALIAGVRKGESICMDSAAVGCSGGRRYLGFADALMPHFDYFLSCGIPAKVEGERYKKTPELVREMIPLIPQFAAPARYIVFKRFDMLKADDKPEVVVFYAPPDVLSGLFTLANFDRAGLDGVICPFSSGCGSIVLYPYLETQTAQPRAVLGLFDVSARPFIPAGALSFAAPMKKFVSMVDNMEESFLTTKSWAAIQKRIP
jgi:uncharacterized protein (DUF169 family)